MKYFFHHDDLPNEVYIGSSIAVDTETTGLNLVRDRLCLIQICTERNEIHLIKITKNSNSPVILNILCNNKILKIFHFARFDLAVLMKQFNCNISNVYCTKIASKLARTSTDNHSLKTLVFNYLSIEIPKFEQTSDWGSHELSNAQLEYAANDVLHLHKLKKILDGILLREGRDKLAKDMFDFLPKLSFLDLEGWDIDSLLSH